jgi:agmatine deiminase
MAITPRGSRRCGALSFLSAVYGKSSDAGIECAAMSTSPQQRRLPAEWETQAGVMLTWPHAQGDWAEVLASVEPVFVAIATAIARRENLLVNCADADLAARIRRTLVAQGVPEHRLFLSLTPSNDTWARDHGPLTVSVNSHPRLLDFRFNGWGNKYPADKDDAINRRLSASGWFDDIPLDAVDLVLEGGSIDSDGEGSLLTTSACLLQPQRNPGLSRQDLETRLRTLFGVERLLWLEHGCIEGDDTDGHVDMLARFASPTTIIYQRCDEPDYGCYTALQAMEQELRNFRDNRGRPYHLVALPWPQPKTDADGARMPASYANFLLINGAVLMPTYRDPADALAARLLQACFPDRELLAIDCLPLIQQHGSLHCVTMQFPDGISLRQAARP